MYLGRLSDVCWGRKEFSITENFRPESTAIIFPKDNSLENSCCRHSRRRLMRPLHWGHKAPRQAHWALWRQHSANCPAPAQTSPTTRAPSRRYVIWPIPWKSVTQGESRRVHRDPRRILNLDHYESVQIWAWSDSKHRKPLQESVSSCSQWRCSSWARPAFPGANSKFPKAPTRYCEEESGCHAIATYPRSYAYEN